MFGDKILEQNLINKCLFLTFLALNALSIWLSTKGDFLRAKFILQKVSSKNMPYREIPVDKILIINLDRRPLRYAKTVAELTKAGLTLGQYQKFSAVDGQHFSKEVIVELMKGGVIAPTDPNCGSKLYNGEEITKGQIGHYLTYRQALRYALDKKMESVLLIEDDTLIKNPSTFINEFWSACKELPEDWDILFLYVSPLTNKFEPYSQHLKKPLGDGNGIWYGTPAVMFRPSAMKAFLEYGFPFEVQADILLGHLTLGKTKGTKPLNAFMSALMGSDLRKSDISTKGRFTPEKIGKIC